MPDINSAPTKHLPPEFIDNEMKKSWFFNEVGNMLKNELNTSNITEEEVEGK